MKFLCVAAVFGIITNADDVNEGPFTSGVGPTYYNNGKAKSVYGYDDTKTACGNATAGWKMCGPSSWKNISQSGVRNMCGTGMNQTPINVVTSAVVVDSTLTYPTMAAGLGCGSYAQLTTDHAFNFGVYANYPATPATPCANPPQLIHGTQTYTMLQGVVHTKSEHTVDGVSYDAEVHLMHKSANGSILVLGMVLDATSPTEHPLLAEFWSKGYSSYKAAGGKFANPSNITMNDFALAASYQYKVHTPSQHLVITSSLHPLPPSLPSPLLC